MKKLLTLLMSITIFGSIYASTDVSGTISSNTTWNLAGSPYIVTGNITLNAGYTLTINSNVVVKFDNGRSLYIYGSLNATSTTFTSNDANPSPGKWNYIRFHDGSSSTLSNCNIEYGRYLNIYDGANLTISGGVIENMSQYAISNSGIVNISNAIIDLANYTSTGHGIVAAGSSSTTLNSTSIINCNYGIHAQSEDAQINITDCTISSNNYPLTYTASSGLSIVGTNTFTGNTHDIFYVYFTTMYSDWTLPYTTSSEVPYYFYSSFTVNNGNTFTVDSKNILKFSQPLAIRGKLVANAASGENIYFTSYKDDNWGGDSNNDGTATAPAVGNWQGILFYDESDDASVMRRCMLRYAGNSNYGGLTLINASPTIDYCNFSNNYFGATFKNASSPTFTNNTIGSSSITPIAMSFEANPTFVNNALSFSDNQYDAIGLLGGTLTADAHIIQRNFTTVNNITYLMLAGITIPSAYTLTIDPGIVIKSTTYSYSIIVEGKIVADGTAAENITFTSVKDDNHGNPGDTNKDGTITTPSIGDMGAIIFKDGSDPTSILDFVRMKYARVYNYSYPNGGDYHTVNNCAIALIGSSPSITNCTFKELQYGISCYTTSSPTLSNNSMTNITYTPFSISAMSNPNFSGNTYTNVGLNALGLLGHNVVINSNIIKRNVAGFTNITYVLLEDIKVLNGANLDISQGTVFKMLNSNIDWKIEGGFKTNGTSTEHIIFTSIKDDNAGNPLDTNGDGNATTPDWNNWDNISFMEVSDDAYCSLLYTDLRYGGYNGLIMTTNASPTLNHLLLDKSYNYGAWFNGNSTPIVSNINITNCRLDPIAMSLVSNPTFSNITFTANGSNGIKIIEGNLSSNATLLKRNLAGFTNIPYIISDLTISSGSTLTLEEGIIIKCRDDYYYSYGGIRVHGALNSTGTNLDNIIFTSIKDDSAGGDTNNDGSSSVPNNSDWDGIIFYGDSDDTQNKLIYSEVRYANGSGYGAGITSNGALRIKDAYVEIDHTVFQQSSTNGIGIYGTANPSITNCEFYNINNEPIFMAMFANPTFSGNTTANIGKMAIGIKNETYSQDATIPLRNFAGYTNITYMFYGATINSGTTITIPAGVTYKSTSNYNFIVNGQLNISGTPSNKVVFTDYRDDSYGNPLDTEGNGNGTNPTYYGPYFTFNDVSDDASTINHAIFRYSTDVIRLNSASPTITNNLFEKVDYGITNSGVCSPVIENNTFNDLDFAPLSISLVSFPASLTGNLITGTTRRGIRVKNETLTQDVTLEKRTFGGITNIPYIFQSYTIGTGVTLTIDPGVICKFQNGGNMYVNNGLIAEGNSTSGNKIIFTSLTDDFFGGDTNGDGDATNFDAWKWGGIHVNAVALDYLTRFEHCIFRNGNGQGIIYTINSSPSFSYCSFNNSQGGVYATGASNPTINFCDFDNMGYYKAVNNVNQSFTIDAENCWWGNNTGPTHSGNPGGTGEEVSDGVDYSPYGTSGAINPILGDASLNGIVQAYDASLILQHVVGTITLNATQQEVADVTGVAGVSALDASYILQYTVGLISNFPASLLTPAFVPTDAELIIANANVNLEEEFLLPISISNVDNLYAMEMKISYDPDILTATDVQNMIEGMNINFTINQDLGLIKIAFAGIESLEMATEAAKLVFHVNENVNMSTITEVEAKAFKGNETDLSENVSNGSITIGNFVGIDPLVKNTPNFSCYPNPFVNKLKIDYTVTEENQNVSIRIFDTYGRMVDELVNGIHSANSYSIVWDGKSLSGKQVANGTYSIQIISGDFVNTQKVLIVR